MSDVNNDSKDLVDISLWEYYNVMKLLLLNEISFDSAGTIIYKSIEQKQSLWKAINILERWRGFFLSKTEYLLYEAILQEFLLVILKNDQEVFWKDTLTDRLFLRYNIISLYIKYYHKLQILAPNYISALGINFLNLIDENYKENKDHLFFDHVIQSIPSLFLIDINVSAGSVFAPYNNMVYSLFINTIEKYQLHMIYSDKYIQPLKVLLALLETQKNSTQNITTKSTWTKVKENAELVNQLIKKLEKLLEWFVEKEESKNSSLFLSKFLWNKDNILLKLKENIIGQDKHIDSIFPSIAKVVLWLNMRPSTFLFSWSSGVGKTRLAEEIAKQLWSEACVINLGNFHSEHTLSTLVGAPPWYLWFTQDTLLEKYKNNLERNYEPWVIPVIVFDEIEKADQSIQNLWLELFDRWTVTLLSGKILDFSRAIIIMTSNLWANIWSRIWFTTSSEIEEKDENELWIIKQIKKFLKPEVLNRIDKTIVFNNLTNEDYLKIKNKVLLDTLQYTIQNNKILSEYCKEKGVDIQELYKKVEKTIPNTSDIEISNIRLYQKEIENVIYEAIITNI